MNAYNGWCVRDVFVAIVVVVAQSLNNLCIIHNIIIYSYYNSTCKCTCVSVFACILLLHITLMLISFPSILILNAFYSQQYLLYLAVLGGARHDHE